MSRAAQMSNRAALAGFGLLTLLLIAGAPPAFASPTSTAQASPDAGISIVNGRSTTIRDWPWQVALTTSRRSAPRAPTSWRFFCGGSVLAPRLVITAAHCVADLKKREIRDIEIVSGRTRLNSNRGKTARVIRLHMPHYPSGKRRYQASDGSANWDVALLQLGSALPVKPIKLAGPDEGGTWSPGHVAWSTGWGVTRASSGWVPTKLKVARQVVMHDGLCRRANGIAFLADTMICHGGPAGNSSTCEGDSGGPLVVGTNAGYRLIGLTSFGDDVCRGSMPSIDTRVSGGPIRKWVARTAMRLTGVDVVGSGAVPGPTPEWCKVPKVFGFNVRQARIRLEVSGCRLGKVRVDRWAAGPRGRIIGRSLPAGWLSPLGFRLNVWIAP